MSGYDIWLAYLAGSLLCGSALVFFVGRALWHERQTRLGQLRALDRVVERGQNRQRELKLAVSTRRHL